MDIIVLRLLVCRERMTLNGIYKSGLMETCWFVDANESLLYLKIHFVDCSNQPHPVIPIYKDFDSRHHIRFERPYQSVSRFFHS